MSTRGDQVQQHHLPCRQRWPRGSCHSTAFAPRPLLPLLLRLAVTVAVHSDRPSGICLCRLLRSAVTLVPPAVCPRLPSLTPTPTRSPFPPLTEAPVAATPPAGPVPCPAVAADATCSCSAVPGGPSCRYSVTSDPQL